MNRKTVWIVLALTVLVVLGVLLVSRNQQTSTTPVIQTPSKTQSETPTPSAETPTDQMTITYSDSGFSPASLTVKVGDSVTFKNDSSKEMWVASAPHPIHTNYPGFDAKAGSSTGEEYTFTFTKAGTWKYHNHLNPSSTGTIIVE